MNIRSAIIWLSLAIQAPILLAQQNMIESAKVMSNQQVWDALVNVDAKGMTIFDQCKIAEPIKCQECACTQYFRANVRGVLGSMGWPKNPASGEGSGCLQGCWGGHTEGMCTSDVQANAKAILLDALSKNARGSDVTYKQKGHGTIFDTSRFVFVEPTLICAKNKYICGISGIAGAVEGIDQIAFLPENICRAAYVVALKMNRDKIKMLSCEDLLAQNQNSAAIQKSARYVGQLNLSYSLANMKGIQNLLDATDSQYASMSKIDVAIIYVALQKNVASLPLALKKRVSELSKDDLNFAERKVRYLNETTITGSSLNLPEAYLQLKQQGSL